MNPSSPETVLLWPLLVYAAGVGAVIVGMIGISYLLGQRHREHATNEPYECGIVSTATARLRVSTDFFLVAIFFVVFDLETVFILIWSTAVRELGWFGYTQICVFVAILLVALGYLWRQRALDL